MSLLGALLKVDVYRRPYYWQKQWKKVSE
jgi:hypothetical protein